MNQRSLAHYEAIETFRGSFADSQILHLCRRRAFVQPLDERLNGRLFPFEMRFDRPVGAIAHPAVDPKFERLLLGPCPEEHPLDAPRNADCSS